MTTEFSMKINGAARNGAAALAMAMLVACGGGGSSDDGTPPVQPPAAEKTGTVALLLRDGPTDEFCQVQMTIERIDLLGTNGPTNIFMGPETVDLLALKNYTDVMTVATEVPIGSYEKIRMTLSDLALVRCDETTGEPESEGQWERPNLPGNGKLDLNPRGPFQVVGGETLLIQLDVDMDKSLHVHQAGNSGRWQFRPVVFVDIVPDSGRLVRVYGEARDATNGTFEICSLEPASSTDDDDHGGGSGMGSDDDSGRCLDVFVDGDTGVFGPDGNPGGPVANGDLVTAIGFLSLHDDDDDGDSKADDLKLDAVVLELGEQGTFLRIRGAASAAPGSNDIFEFDPDAVPDLTDIIDVLLQSGTRIFEINSTNELTSAAIQPGTTGEVDGVFTDPAAVPPTQPFKSALVVLDQDTTPELSIVGAKIKVISPDDDVTTPETRRIEVSVSGGANQCVKTDASTRYLKIEETATSSVTSTIVFADLLLEDDVDVYGTTDPVDGSCVLADVIQKYVASP